MNQETPGTGNGNGSPASAGTRNFLLQQLYIKDLSFESPSAPQVFHSGKVEPETELNIRNGHVAIGEDLYEVTLHVTVHAQHADKTIFLAELEQAGVFLIQGYTADETNMLLGTHCPATLFPYARETISSLVGKGGFPPLVLQPISFEALYARAREQQEAQA